MLNSKKALRIFVGLSVAIPLMPSLISADQNSRSRLIEAGANQEVSVPLPRVSGPLISQSVSPYILMHSGARENDNNGSWKRHTVNIPDGNVHVLYPVFDGHSITNNRNQYNCYNPTTGTMTFAVGAEPHTNPPQSDQNGGIDVTPSGRAIWVGRGVGANLGTIVNFDSGACLGQITTKTVSTDPRRPLDPAVYVVDETTWVALMSNFIGSDIGGSRTTDGGETWTPQIPVIVSSFLNFAVAGNRETIWVASTGLPDDSTVFNDREHILWTRSTDGGITWDIPAHDATGDFELPNFQPLVNGSLSALMVADTFHIVWLDRASGTLFLPGGHVHHLSVSPNGSVDGPHLVAEINLFYDESRDNSTTGFVLGFGIWQHPTLAYRPPGLLPPPNDGADLFCLWSSPPEDSTTPGIQADTTDPSVSGGRVFPCADIWCSGSFDNGRSWDLKTNVTKTNHPGCNGTTTPCEHEFYISAAAVADSLIYVVAQVNKFPGFQNLGDPGPDTRLSDEWRLYKVPARSPFSACTLGVDTVPPTIRCSNIVTKVTSPGSCEGGKVFFQPFASDNCSGASFTCTPPSGSFFLLGITSVTCIAMDSAGNKDSCTFTVTLRDFYPPSVSCNPDTLIVGNTSGRCDATVDYLTPDAIDNCPGPVPVVCMPPSGSILPLGATVVRCVATDISGNKSSCAFIVTVIDSEPPVITCPNNIIVNTDSGRCDAAKVNFAASATDICSNPTVLCVPPSGSIFPRGTTKVNCIARDVYSNFDTCSFTVTVIKVKGDLNRDTILTASDVMLELNCVFLGITPPAGDCACDLNCDGVASPADVVLELNKVFLDIPFPCP